MENEHISTGQPLLIKYMTILFLLVSFLSILGLFLLSRIYWTKADVSNIKQTDNTFCFNASKKIQEGMVSITQFDKNLVV
jgi:hypothetical protein